MAYAWQSFQLWCQTSDALSWLETVKNKWLNLQNSYSRNPLIHLYANVFTIWSKCVRTTLWKTGEKKLWESAHKRRDAFWSEIVHETLANTTCTPFKRSRPIASTTNKQWVQTELAKGPNLWNTRGLWPLRRPNDGSGLTPNDGLSKSRQPQDTEDRVIERVCH